MSKLTSRRQYETGSGMQVLHPDGLSNGEYIQFDSVRKPQITPVRLVKAAGAFLSLTSVDDGRTRLERTRTAWRDSGLMTEAAFRGRIVYMGERAMVLALSGFDFHAPIRPMTAPPAVHQPETDKTLVTADRLIAYGYDEIGLASIGTDNGYYTRDDLGRYALAVVHHLPETNPDTTSETIDRNPADF